MPRGQGDFGQYAPTKAIAGMSDMGELAARLDSINTYDRKGQTIWQEGFEDGIVKWYTNVEGDGGSIAVSTDTARNGGKSCKIITGTVAGNEGQISRYVSKPLNSRIGLELSHTTTADVGYHKYVILINVGANWLSGQVKYDPTTETLSYLDSAGVFQDFDTDSRTYQQLNYFAQVKLVIDLDTGYYVRLLFGNKEYDM